METKNQNFTPYRFVSRSGSAVPTVSSLPPAAYMLQGRALPGGYSFSQLFPAASASRPGRRPMASINATELKSTLENEDETRRVRDIVQDLDPPDDEYEYLTDHSGISMV